MRRDVVVSLSLATLWFIGVWSDLLPFLYISDRFPIGALPCWNDFAAVMVNVVTLAALFTLAGSLARRGPAWLRDAAGVVLATLTIMFPLVLVTAAQGFWAIAQAGGRMQCGSAAGLAETMSGAAERRVLWVVYDELDYATSFANRPADLRLPAFDRLVAEGMSASAAVPPGVSTERSMPSFLSGVRVTDAALVGRNQLMLQIDDRPTRTAWTSRDTLLPKVRALGLNAAIAGFFLPYCSLVGDSVTECTWEPCVTCGRLTGVFGSSFADSLKYQVAELAPRYGPRRHLGAYRDGQRAALALAGDPAIGFALLHLPVPHAPAIFDRHRDDFAIGRVAGDGYLHNLALADRSLGEIHEAVEQAGLSGRTTIVVFGDHGRRDPPGSHEIADPRVPFIIKVAGESRPVRYDDPLEALAVHDLTLELLAGRVTSLADVERWLRSY